MADTPPTPPLTPNDDLANVVDRCTEEFPIVVARLRGLVSQAYFISHRDQFQLWVDNVDAHRKSGNDSPLYRIPDSSWLKWHLQLCLEVLSRELHKLCTCDKYAKVQRDYLYVESGGEDELDEEGYSTDEENEQTTLVDRHVKRAGNIVRGLVLLTGVVLHQASEGEQPAFDPEEVVEDGEGDDEEVKQPDAVEAGAEDAKEKKQPDCGGQNANFLAGISGEMDSEGEEKESS